MATPQFIFQQTSLQPSPATYLSGLQNRAEGKPEGAMTSTSNLLGAVASSEYTYRAPSPPHIHIPQAPDDRQLSLTPSPNFTCNASHRTTLLSILSSNRQSIAPREWKYASRRQSQPILPFIYLGPSSSARDIPSLLTENITLLLVIRDASMAQSKFLSGDNVASQLGIESAAIDVTGNTQLIAAFPRAVQIINEHLVRIHDHCRENNLEMKTGKVLVFCESGNERSATVVAAYLMHMYALDEIAAIQYVQTQRFCVAFDDGLKHLLRAYADILRARSVVGEGLIVQGTEEGRQRDASMNRAKRGRDDVDDEDDVNMNMNMNMEVEMDATRRDDEERFGRRAAFMPFRDMQH